MCDFDVNEVKHISSYKSSPETIENLDASIDDLSSTSATSLESIRTSSILKSLKKSTDANKRRVLFDSVDIFYFDRKQGFTCVPCQGGYTLGMANSHSSYERFPLKVFQRRRRRERHQYLYKRWMDGKLFLSMDQTNFLKRSILDKNIDPPSPLSSREDGEISSCSDSSSSFGSSSRFSDSFLRPGDSSSDECDEQETESIKKLEDNLVLNAISLKKRKIILKRAGVAQIDEDERLECENIRQSRTVCGCNCPNGICYPSTCQCALNGIPCQVDRASFPCACMMPSSCSNPLGRVKFDQAKARTHYLHTRMRLEIEQTGKTDWIGLNKKRSIDVAARVQTTSSEAKKSCFHLNLPESHDSIEETSGENECFLANFNTTISGGCRDCQNDRYVNVLMREWKTSTLNPYYTPDSGYGADYEEEEVDEESNIAPWNVGLETNYYSAHEETISQASENINYFSHHETHLYMPLKEPTSSNNSSDNEHIFDDFHKTDVDHVEYDLSSPGEFFSIQSDTLRSHRTPCSPCKLDPISCFLPSVNLLKTSHIPSQKFFDDPDQQEENHELIMPVSFSN